MNAPHAARLDHPWVAPPPPGCVIEVAPCILWLRMPLPFALDHINLWLLRRAVRLHARRLRVWRRADARAVERHFAETMRGAPLARILARTITPIISATRSGSRRGSPVRSR